MVRVAAVRSRSTSAKTALKTSNTPRLHQNEPGPLQPEARLVFRTQRWRTHLVPAQGVQSRQQAERSRLLEASPQAPRRHQRERPGGRHQAAPGCEPVGPRSQEGTATLRPMTGRDSSRRARTGHQSSRLRPDGAAPHTHAPQSSHRTRRRRYPVTGRDPSCAGSCQGAHPWDDTEHDSVQRSIVRSNPQPQLTTNLLVGHPVVFYRPTKSSGAAGAA